MKERIQVLWQIKPRHWLMAIVTTYPNGTAHRLQNIVKLTKHPEKFRGAKRTKHLRERFFA